MDPAFTGSARRLGTWSAAGGAVLGVVYGDMQLRNVGIVGYAGLFPVGEVLIGVLFQRTKAAET